MLLNRANMPDERVFVCNPTILVGLGLWVHGFGAVTDGPRGWDAVVEISGLLTA